MTYTEDALDRMGEKLDQISEMVAVLVTDRNNLRTLLRLAIEREMDLNKRLQESEKRRETLEVRARELARLHDCRY